MRTKLSITEGIFPMPVLMVATYNEDGSVNVMNAAWGTMQERETVVLNLTETHKTVKNIKARGAFTVSIADAAHVIEADYFGVESGNRTADKFTRSGLTASKAQMVDAPVINEFPLCLECEFVEYQDGKYGCGVIGKVVNVTADESVMENGKLILTIEDSISGINYDSIYATDDSGTKILPDSCDKENGEVTFKLEEGSLTVYVEDMAGNPNQAAFSINQSGINTSDRNSKFPTDGKNGMNGTEATEAENETKASEAKTSETKASETKSAKASSTKAEAKASSAAKSTTAAKSSSAAKSTTAAAKSTSAAAKSTTAAKKSTSAAAKSTTAAQKSTSAAAKSTTAAQKSTSAAAKSTTKAAKSTTAAHEPTTAEAPATIAPLTN